MASFFTAKSGSPLTARKVNVAEFFESAVTLPTVSDHLRARFDEVCHEGVQRCRRCIGQRPHPATAEPFRFQDFYGDAGQDFLGDALSKALEESARGAETGR